MPDDDSVETIDDAVETIDDAVEDSAEIGEKAHKIKKILNGPKYVVTGAIISGAVGALMVLPHWTENYVFNGQSYGFQAGKMAVISLVTYAILRNTIQKYFAKRSLKPKKHVIKKLIHGTENPTLADQVAFVGGVGTAAVSVGAMIVNHDISLIPCITAAVGVGAYLTKKHFAKKKQSENENTEGMTR